MGEKRQKIRKTPASTNDVKGEPPNTGSRGFETPVVDGETKSPVQTERLMKEVVERENLRTALKRVKANKGSAGVDGMSVGRLPGYLRKNWPAIREELLNGKYVPKPVRRVEIPKPTGGKRKLGIPTVMDRFIQQAILQVLQKLWDPTFSESSYGFRPGRSAHQAVARAREYIAMGCQYVVDIDLEKFFDTVNHDMLMGRVAKRVKDKRLLKLMRAFLNAGVMENGLVELTDRGTPQGGPLSPLLSNIVLDDLDRELERRGHRFVRYADDCNIYVKTLRAGERVMASVARFIERKLKLKVNREKSAVAEPRERKFLGFSFTSGREPKIRISSQALERFKDRVRWYTRRTRGMSLQEMVRWMTPFVRGWLNYFSLAQTMAPFERMGEFVRRRLRCVACKQWKRGRTRFRALYRRGVSRQLAAKTASSARGYYRISSSKALHVALPNKYFLSLGLPDFTARRGT